MLIVILFSNAGFAVNVHYCKGKVEKIELGYFNYNISCEHQVEKGCCTSEKCTADDAEESCCADETISNNMNKLLCKISHCMLLPFSSLLLTSLNPLFILYLL